MEIIEGEVFPNEFDNYKFILNETAIKEVGELYTKDENFMGVARDFYLSPTTKVKPTIIYSDFHLIPGMESRQPKTGRIYVRGTEELT